MPQSDTRKPTVSSSSRLVRHLARVAAALLAATATMFFVGVIIERNQPAHNESTDLHAASGGEGHDDTTERAERAITPTDGSESVLGVDTESNIAVTAVVAASLLLASVLWFSGRRAIAFTAAAVAAVFTIFDTAEVVRQLNESRRPVAALAAAIAVGHAAVVVLTTYRPRIKRTWA